MRAPGPLLPKEPGHQSLGPSSAGTQEFSALPSPPTSFLSKVPGVQAPASPPPPPPAPVQSGPTLWGRHRLPRFLGTSPGWEFGPWDQGLPTHLSGAGIQHLAEAAQGTQKLQSVFGPFLPSRIPFLWPLVSPTPPHKEAAVIPESRDPGTFSPHPHPPILQVSFREFQGLGRCKWGEGAASQVGGTQHPPSHPGAQSLCPWGPSPGPALQPHGSSRRPAGRRGLSRLGLTWIPSRPASVPPPTLRPEVLSAQLTGPFSDSRFLPPSLFSFLLSTFCLSSSLSPSPSLCLCPSHSLPQFPSLTPFPSSPPPSLHLSSPSPALLSSLSFPCLLSPSLPLRSFSSLPPPPPISFSLAVSLPSPSLSFSFLLSLPLAARSQVWSWGWGGGGWRRGPGLG